MEPKILENKSIDKRLVSGSKLLPLRKQAIAGSPEPLANLTGQFRKIAEFISRKTLYTFSTIGGIIVSQKVSSVPIQLLS